MVTQWNISAIGYDNDSSAFEGSYMEEWLNDTTVDGFLGNLRDYENFIVTDAKWNATMNPAALDSITRPSDSGTIVTETVGLLNMYEYQSSYHGTTYSNGYLNNGLNWWTLTPYSLSSVRFVNSGGQANAYNPSNGYGVRPSINLKSSVKIVVGDGTEEDPYRLLGDNDTNLSGELLNTRYSGEYIRFGNSENNLYRIVSHENRGLTKITSSEPLKNSGTFVSSVFGNSSIFSSTNTIGTFLNGEYLNNYIDSSYSDIIEESSTWYLGIVGDGISYKLAKYTDTNMSSLTSSTTNAKVGLLRMGELMAGQFDRYGNNASYWLLTPYSSSSIRYVDIYDSMGSHILSTTHAIKLAISLKSNVVITGGTGLKDDPFTLSVQ